MAAEAHNKVRVPATAPASPVLLSPKPLISFMLRCPLPELFNRRLYVNHICCAIGFGGCRVDCVVEIGEPGTIAMSLKALAVGGHVSLIGASLSQSGAGLDPLLLTGRGITLGSISVASRADFGKPAVPPGR